MAMRKCGNCANRCWTGWDGLTFCMGYEYADTEADEIKEAETCKGYIEGTPSCYSSDDGRYCPSSTYGDYSPSNPWDAPGMSIRDFI